MVGGLGTRVNKWRTWFYYPGAGAIPSYLVVSPEVELELYCLLESLETPFALFLLQRRNAQEVGDGFVRIGQFQLFCIVVLILDVDIAGFVFLVLLVLEVISETSWLTVGG